MSVDRMATEIQETGQVTSLGATLAQIIAACQHVGVHPADVQIIGVGRLLPDVFDQGRPILATTHEQEPGA